MRKSARGALFLLAGLAACATLPVGERVGWEGEPVQLNAREGAFVRTAHPYPVGLIARGERVVVGWLERGEGSQAGEFQDVYVRVSADGGRTWETPQRLREGRPDIGRALAPFIVSVGGERVAAAWTFRQLRGGGGRVLKDIQVRVSSDFGRTWEGQRVINRESNGFEPKLAADGRGGVFALWYDERPPLDGDSATPSKRKTSRTIYFNRLMDHGATWGEDRRLDEGIGLSLLPMLVFDAGKLHAAWQESGGGQGVRFLHRWSGDGGAAWSPIQPIDDDPAFEVFQPSLVPSGDGALHAVWSAWDPRRELWQLRHDVSRDGGRTWGRDRVLYEGSKNWALAPHLVAKGEHLHLAWQAREGEHVVVNFLASRDGGRTWSEKPLRLNRDRDYRGNALHPRLAADGRGGVYAVWESDKEALRHIYMAYSRDHGRSWSEVLRVDPESRAEARFPQVEVLEPGVLGVVWETWGREGNNLHFRRVRMGDGNDRSKVPFSSTPSRVDKAGQAVL